ncbi:unnamed protein product [Symbiodinium natans]|uniref:Uncharacterized protein n=1 Tax=Symbiodinium natans TaxID=878477 RepID=A0A812LA17_9DINO|nr:unnamed protein product [Symbiodinium natans]
MGGPKTTEASQFRFNPTKRLRASLCSFTRERLEILGWAGNKLAPGRGLLGGIWHLGKKDIQIGDHRLMVRTPVPLPQDGTVENGEAHALRGKPPHSIQTARRARCREVGKGAEKGMAGAECIKQAATLQMGCY